MTLLNPVALALGALGLPIVLLYILKLYRPEYRVPSTLLWRRSLDDIQANSPWQRLRPNLLLLLQLLVLLALVVALARPAYSEAHSFTGDLVVIVDESPGMTATDVVPSRFAVALSRIRRLQSELVGGSVMSVIGMGAQPHLAVVESADPSAIARGIDSLQVGVTRPNFLGALSVAASLARSAAQTRVVVLTSPDSGIHGPPAAVPYSLEIEWLGGKARDLGITAFHAAHVQDKTVATITVRNFGRRASASDLNLYADGQLADVRPVSVAGGQQQTLFWTQLPSGIGRLEARVTVSDDVAFDKTAWLVLPSNSSRRILLVTSGNFWLRAALALDHSFKITAISPVQYQDVNPVAFDLVIFDGFLPHALPAASVLLIAPPAGRVGPINFGGTVKGGAAAVAPLTATSQLASLLQYVDLSDVHVSYVRQLHAASWMQELITSAGHALVAAGDSGTTRVGVIPFALQNSDWPLRMSFPIVIHNMLEYLAPRLALGTQNLEAGQPLSLFAGPSVRDIDVSKPNGVTKHLMPPYGSFADTVTPGFYSVQERGDEQRHSAVFAVNVFEVHGTPVEGAHFRSFGVSYAGKSAGVPTHISLSWALALISLCLLSAEWWFAWRR
ncbi:MAG: BatA and WFA domain-containing protein [Chloroflexota bacterium]